MKDGDDWETEGLGDGGTGRRKVRKILPEPVEGVKRKR